MLTRKLTFVLALMAAVPAGAQNVKAPLDGQKRQFFDDLLDHLRGAWTMTGQILGQPVTHRVTSEWTLNHQFLHFHEKDTADPPAYEVDVYIGYDNMSERHVGALAGRVWGTLFRDAWVWHTRRKLNPLSV